MTEHEIKEIIDKYLQGKTTAQEEQLLEDFLDSYQPGNKDWNKELLGERSEKATQLFAKVQQQITPQPKRTYRIMAYWKVAAAVIFLVAISWAIRYWPQDPVTGPLLTKATGPGQKSTLVLSDGTQVRLNSGSEITYPQRFSQQNREVILEGEAFFDVKNDPGRPFIIHSTVLKTTVLGTSFNISAFPGQDQHVTVATGRVKVEAPGEVSRQEVILSPAEQAYFDRTKGNLGTKKIDLVTVLAWKEGVLQFDKVTLEQAVKVLERWYNVRITLANEALKHCVIRGKYKDENLRNVLESLKFVNEIDYQWDSTGHVTITGKGCPTQKTTPME